MCKAAPLCQSSHRHVHRTAKVMITQHRMILRDKNSVVSFFIFFKTFQTKKKKKELRPKTTKVALGSGSCINKSEMHSISAKRE